MTRTYARGEAEVILSRIHAKNSKRNELSTFRLETSAWEDVKKEMERTQDPQVALLHLRASGWWRVPFNSLLELGESPLLTPELAFEVSRHFSSSGRDPLTAAEEGPLRAAGRSPMGAFLWMNAYYWWFGAEYELEGTRKADFEALAAELLADLDLCAITVNLLAGLLHSREGFGQNNSALKVLEVVELARRIVTS